MSTQKNSESKPLKEKSNLTNQNPKTQTENYPENKPSSSTEKKNYFLTTIKNTSNFVLISLITKVLNLAINIFVIRKVTKQTFGIAKIYFESAYLMLQYFPLETMRKTTQKYCCSVENEELENTRFAQCSRIMWLLNFIFMLITIPVWYLYVSYGENLSDVGLQMFLHLLSSNIELYVEPIMLYCNIKFLNNYRLVLNTLGNYTRVLSTFVFVIFFDMELWGFTLARLLSSSVYVLYAVYINHRELKINLNTVFPFLSAFGFGDEKENCGVKSESELLEYKSHKNGKKSGDKNFWKKFLDYFLISNYANLFNPLLKEIFMSFVYINILKMILTYTEKIFLSFFIKFHESEKSEYSFVTDNFAILIRFFLEPLETNFFNLINKIKAPAEEESKIESNRKTKKEKNENEEFSSPEETEALYARKIDEHEKKKKRTVKKIMNILNLFLRFLLIFGFLLVGYIYTIGKEVFSLVFGSAWVTDSAIVILRNYAIYIFIISINGVIEAFCNAIANARQMKLFNKMMILNSVCLISFSIMLNGYSVLGLVYANGLAMLFRILGNIYIIFSAEAPGNSSNSAEAQKNRYFAVKTEQAKGAYKEFDILRSLSEMDKEGENAKMNVKADKQMSSVLRIARLFVNCLFTFKTFVVYVFAVMVVFRISRFSYFEDSNHRVLFIVNNNFINVALAGVVFLANVFVIYLFERADFKRIYNESV